MTANRERMPLAGSLVLMGLGAAWTGFNIDGGIAVGIAGVAVVVIGILTAFSHGSAYQVRAFDLAPKRARISPSVDARVAWSGAGAPPQEVREALGELGVRLEAAPVQVETKTRIFTAHMESDQLRTNEDDLQTRGLQGMALIKTARNLGTELGEHTLVELTLTVRMEGKDPFTVRNLSLVPNDQLITVGANLTVPVLVDPEDQTRLTVDWEAG
jgi:hypothetical protein